MAEGDRPSVEPELRVARLLLKRTGFTPPVPIDRLLIAHADVERAIIPLSIDGLVLRRGLDARPCVILNSRRRNTNRERFTAAHELAHIILPWHSGTVLCHTDETFTTTQVSYGEIEVEANRFAGELLVPMYWARAALDACNGRLASRIVRVALAAEVSPLVVAFSASRVLDRAIIFALHDGRTLFSIYGSVFGQWGRTEWSDALQEKYRAQGAQCSTQAFGSYAIHCVEFEPESMHLRSADVSSDILRYILENVGGTAQERARAIASVNGVVGSANQRTGAVTARHILLALKARFAARPNLRGVMTHPRFEEYLSAKARELARKRTQRT